MMSSAMIRVEVSVEPSGTSACCPVSLSKNLRTKRGRSHSSRSQSVSQQILTSNSRTISNARVTLSQLWTSQLVER